MVKIQEIHDDGILEAHKLSVEIFGESANSEKYSVEKWRAHLKENGLLLGAFDDKKLVGFKFGYQRKEGEFHSWLGGVRSTYRRQGVMSALTARQEEWVRASGSMRAITVNTYREKFPAMYQLLLAEGYVATDQTNSDPEKTHFRKDLF